MVRYGYRYGEEFQLPAIPPVRDNFTIKTRNYADHDRRRPVAVSLGAHVVGQCQFRPDQSDGPSVAAGLMRRVGAQTKTCNPEMLVRARQFTFDWCRTHLTPLPADHDWSTETWIENTNYSAEFKDYLRKVRNFPFGQLPKKYFRFASFVKEEDYAEPKHLRTIQAPSDELKKHVGPALASVEHEIFKMPCFIKKIPVDQRPKYILERLGAFSEVRASDFSSFECSWQTAQMQAFELPVIEYMLQDMPGCDAFFEVFNKMELGDIRLVFKWVTAIARSTRKSGTNNTSLSNGVGNMLIHEFAARELDLGELIGVFEGDDGLFRYTSGRFPTTEFYQNLGFDVKLETCESVATASFCGMVFDINELQAVWDPIDVVVRIGWGGSRYTRAKDATLKALLKSKAMSWAHQAPGCPVVAAMAHWILRCTKQYDIRKVLASRNLGWWEREKLLSAIAAGDPVRQQPGPATRKLVETKFGLDIATQLAMEQWFDAQTDIRPIPAFTHNMQWETCFDTYVRPLGAHIHDDYPVFPYTNLSYPRAQKVPGSHNLILPLSRGVASWDALPTSYSCLERPLDTSSRGLRDRTDDHDEYHV